LNQKAISRLLGNYLILLNTTDIKNQLFNLNCPMRGGAFSDSQMLPVIWNNYYFVHPIVKIKIGRSQQTAIFNQPVAKKILFCCYYLKISG